MVDTKDAAQSKRADRQVALSWHAVFATYLPALVIALGAGIALPAVPTLAKSFDVSFGVASGVVTAYMLGNFAGTIPTGWMIDRFGLRWVMIGAPLLTSVTAFQVLYAHSFPELLALRFVNGLAAQMWVMGRLAAISKDAPASERGRLISWMFGMDNTGKLAGPALGGFIAGSWGTTAPFAAYGVLALLAIIPSLLISVDAPRRGAGDAQKAPTAPRGLSLREMIMPRLPFFGVALFAGLSRGPVGADLLHLYAAFAYHLGPREIGFLATGAAIISWPIGFIAGWILDRFGRKRTMVPGFGGVAISMILLAISASFGLSYAWYVPLFFVAVATQALTGGSIQTVGADVAPPEARGAFLGLWRFTGQGGGALSPVIFALLVEQLSYSAAFVFTACCGAMVAYLLIVHVPETRNDR